MIRANASGLRSKLNRIIEAVNLAPYALSEVAVDTIGDVTRSAVDHLAPRQDQVGFDLAQFIRNIQEPGPIEVLGASGNVGILDVNRMGTLEDFDRIAGTFPSLWHEGHGRAATFQQAVFDRPAVREAVATGREAVWNPTTPQWRLLNDGYSGSDAYPPVPASHFIESATIPIRVMGRMVSVMSKLFKGIS